MQHFLNHHVLLVRHLVKLPLNFVNFEVGAALETRS